MTHRRTSASGRTRGFRVAIAAVAAAILAVGPVTAAQGAGPAVLSLDVSITSDINGTTPVTEIDAQTMGFAYLNVAYSCSVVDCEDVVIRVAPSQVDPNYGYYHFGDQGAHSYRPPFTPAPALTGTPATGFEIALGDIEIGSGSLTIGYRIGSRYAGAQSGSFFTDGFVIAPEVEAEASNSDFVATDPSPATATWVSTVPPELRFSLSSSATIVRTDTPIDYTVGGDSRCVSYNAASALVGAPWLQCAESYDIVVQLPPDAVYQDSTHGGEHDEVANTVTWSDSGRGAAIGPGYETPTVTVVYPSGTFVPDAGGCSASRGVSAEFEVTYLDQARTVREASRSLTHTVQNCDPFPRGRIDAKTVTRDAGTYNSPIEYIPETGSNAGYWQIDLWNTANIDGVATLVDDDLDQPGMPVTRVTTNVPATIEWTIENNTTGVQTSGNSATTYTAPSGSRIVAATLISSVLPGPNLDEDGTLHTLFRARYEYAIQPTAEPGPRTNTASATMTYPSNPEFGVLDLDSVERTVTLTPQPVEPPRVRAFAGVTVPGGGVAIPGTEVEWRVNGDTAFYPEGSSFEPQYVFIAPPGWEIVDGSASFSAAVPEGADIRYETDLVYDGVAREGVVVTWPEGTSFGVNATLPTLRLNAFPTAAAAGGTNTGYALIGDALHSYDTTTGNWRYAHIDVEDYDQDGETTEPFATQTANVSVAASSQIGVLKEICLEDSDGECTWIADPSVLVGVSPAATDITYRVTLSNQSSTPLSNVVAYDVLPHDGDTGLIPSTGTTERGSEFAETLVDVTDVSEELELSYSTSTNPPRDEVYDDAPGASGVWDTTVAGARAIRAALPGTLAAGASVTFTYTAAVEAGASAGEIACNSVAAVASGLAAFEPPAVCAIIQAADLEIVTADRLPLQSGRVGTVPFTVQNLGGSPEAPATVTISIPEGVTVMTLDPEGWACTSEEEDGEGQVPGPGNLECTPVEETGLVVGTPLLLELPVLPDASIDETSACFLAEISGLLYDGDLDNNVAEACSTVVAGAKPLVAIEKDDGVEVTEPGATLSYEITVDNYLVGETITGATVVDTLPDNVVFVSASDGGVHSGVAAGEPGGVVTWTLPDLGPSGVAGDGTTGTGGAGSTTTLTVTVQVIDDTVESVENAALVDAPDPVDPEAQLCDGDDCAAEDIDGLRVLTIEKSSDAAEAGVTAGDIVSYAVVVANAGTGDFTAADPAVVVDDLSEVLDDATFVPGSATVAIGSDPATPLADPVADLLSWSGALPAGASARIEYRVEVGEDGDGLLRNVAYAADEPTDCVDGVDEDGLACAVLEDGFALLLDKAVTDLAQGDDGLWTIEYELAVTNPSPLDAEYELSDELAFGPGILVDSAEVSDAPAGVTLADPAWDGSGAIATEAEIAESATHVYTVTVVADALALGGTPAAECTDGSDGGFGNVATLALAGGLERVSGDCAEPVEPTIEKELDGAPVRNPDGSWTVAYLVTVTNEHAAPSGGLSYRVDDELGYPAGIAVRSVAVDAPAGVAVNPGYTAGLDELDGAAVTPDAALVDGAARIPAAGAEPAEHVYRVTVVLVAAEGSVGDELLACGAPGAGYGNVATLLAPGGTGLGAASACADIALPELRFTLAADREGTLQPGDVVTYTITLRNTGGADFTDGDPAVIMNDFSGMLDDASYRDDAVADAGTLVPLTDGLGWFGPIPAGGVVTITYGFTVGEPRGDGELVNIVGRPDGDPETAVECAAEPSSYEGDACLVTLAIEPLAVTGVVPLLAPLALALLGAGAGALGSARLGVRLRGRGTRRRS